MKKLFLLLSFIYLSLAALAQGPNSFGGVALRVNDTTTYQAAATAFHTAGYYDIYFNNQATTKHWDVWNGSSYDHVFDFNSGGSGSSAWGGITGTLSNQTDLQAALDAKQAIANSSSSLSDGSSITITGPKHTLTSTQATVTWTLSQAGDFQTTDITLNATSTTWTFPANTLCVVDGVASGNNVAVLSGTSGDHHIMSIYKDGTNYRVVIKNFGQ